jgi:uncharacterized protein with ATP-grasp and redox domains
VSKQALPPYISTADPGSYAHYAVSVRQPRIIEQVVQGNQIDPSARAALLDLVREIREGTVSSPLSSGRVAPESLEADERATWERQIAAWQGRRWLDIPWYFAESFFYLKLLAAFGYYEGGPDRAVRRDPFHAQKERELLDPDGGLALARRVLASVQTMGDEEALAFHLHSALWGNRLDLSTFEVDETRRKNILTRDADSLLVDHTADSLAALTRADCVHVLLDNSGPELVCDLLLADRLLSWRASQGRAPSSITLHAKKAPFFVSDATVADTLRTVDALAGDEDARAAMTGGRLRDALRSGRLRIRDHWFWNSALHFTAFPRDLKKELRESSVLVLKGDANYRRTLEDRKWDTSASLDDCAGYFPAPFIALRTMKSELVVDIPQEEARRLYRLDPQWMTNGKRGLIRFCRVREPASCGRY